MPSSEPTLVATLREKQKSFNEAVDRYVNIANEDGSNQTEFDAAQQRIMSLSASITNLTTNPVLEAARFGLRPMLHTPVRIAIDLSLFTIIGSDPVTIDDIVTATSADRTLIVRITRRLAAFRILNQTAASTFASTPLSSTFRDPVIAAWIKMGYDNCVPRSWKIPSFFAETSHSVPFNVNALDASKSSGQSF